MQLFVHALNPKQMHLQALFQNIPYQLLPVSLTVAVIIYSSSGFTAVF